MSLREELLRQFLYITLGLLIGALAQVTLYADNVKHTLDTLTGVAVVLPHPWDYILLGLVGVGNAAWSIYNWNKSRRMK